MSYKDDTVVGYKEAEWNHPEGRLVSQQLNQVEPRRWMRLTFGQCGSQQTECPVRLESRLVSRMTDMTDDEWARHELITESTEDRGVFVIPGRFKKLNK